MIHPLLMAGKQNICEVVASRIKPCEVHCTHFFCTSSLLLWTPPMSRIVYHNLFLYIDYLHANKNRFHYYISFKFSTISHCKYCHLPEKNTGNKKFLSHNSYEYSTPPRKSSHSLYPKWKRCCKNTPTAQCSLVSQKPSKLLCCWVFFLVVV